MEKAKIKELRGKAHKLDPTVRIGKSGITESIIEELKGQLKQKKLVKAKVLGCDRNEVKRISEELSQRSKSELIDVKGNVIVMYKR